MEKLRKLSRENPGSSEYKSCGDEFIIGCLQRLVHARQIVLNKYVVLQSRVDSLERQLANSRRRSEMLVHQKNALRGVITKMKNRLK